MAADRASWEVLELGPFHLDLEDRQLRLGEETVPITPKSFDTLLVLARAGGKVVSREDLFTAVWPDTFIQDSTLTQNIYSLRKALESAGYREDPIETVPRRGYRLLLPVQGRRREGTSESASPSLTSGEASTQSLGLEHLRNLAVLPFRVLGQDEDSKFYGMGLADALITRLSRVSSLTIRPTSSILSQMDGEISALELGRKLQVDALLEGTLQTLGGHSRATVQLVDMETGTTLWAKRFDTETTDAFALQDFISEQTTQALELRIRGHVEREERRRPTQSPEAYEAYLRGRFFWNKRTGKDLRTAIQWFERAATLDPAYAHAHAGIADCNVLLPLYSTTSANDAFPAAIQAARRALSLDDRLADAHTSLAYAQCFYHWDWRSTEEGYRRALDLDPGYSTAYHWYSFFLAARGRHEESIRHAQKAREIDPLSLVINTDLGFVLYFARRFDDAIAQYRQTLELDPDFPYTWFALALAYLELGNLDKALAAAEHAVELTSTTNTAMMAVYGLVLAKGGATGQARSLLDELHRQNETETIPASRFALIHLGLGEKDGALDCLREACEEKSRFAVFLPVWPLFDPLRSDPQFASLLREQGLALPMEGQRGHTRPESDPPPASGGVR